MSRTTWGACAMVEVMDLRPIERQFSPTFRRASDPGGPTRRECWAARTVDGLWAFERLEETGTPWQVIYKPRTDDFELCPGLFATLRAARQAVEAGHVKPPSQWNAEHAAGQHDGRCGDCRPCQHDRGEHRSFARTDCPTCTATRPEGAA